MTEAPKRPRLDDPIDRERTRSSVGARLFGSRRQEVKIGRFEIAGTAGAGQMGRVYIGLDPDLDRKVAIKVIGDGSDHKLARSRERRLAREARAIAKLSHPNVIAVHEVGHHEGALFIVMEYVQGETLRDWLATPRPWREALRVMVAAGRGLAAAHGSGLVHRDFKPANVMIRTDGRVVVLDFGLARLPSEHATSDGERLDLAEAPEDTLTAAGAVVGTPAYMAPELHRGAPADERSDQFAFCVTLFEALHGERPFEFQRWHRDTGPAIVRRPRKIPDWLHHLIVRGVDEDPAMRHESMHTLLATLTKRRLRARTIALGGVVVAAIAGLGASGGTLLAGTSCDGGKERLAVVWNEARRSALLEGLQALHGSGDASTRRIGDRLDAYAARWTDAHRDACERTHVHRDQSESMLDLRIACLDERLSRFDALVDVLESADEATLHNAPEAVETLPELSRCEDVQQLDVIMLPPSDARAAAVEAARQEIAKADALMDAGRFRDGLAIAEHVAANEIGFAPLHAEVLVTLGRAQDRVVQPEAERTLLDAASVAESSGHDEALANAWWHLVFNTTSGERAAFYLERFEALMSRRVQSAELEQMLAEIHGTAARKADDLDSAVEHFTRARELALGRGEVAARKAASYLLTLTNVTFSLGRWADSRRYAEQAYDELLEVHGPNHPLIVHAIRNQGVALVMAGEYRAAIPVFERAFERALEVLGEGHPDTAAAIQNAGVAYQNLGEFEEALAAYRRGIQITEAAHGTDDPRVARSLGNIAGALTELGRLDEAVENSEKALAILEKAHGDKHRETAQARSTLGSIYLRAERYDDGLAMLQRALAVELELAGGRETVDTASTHAILADAYRKTEDLVSAQAEAEESLAILRNELGDEHTMVGRGWNTLGYVHIARRQFAEAAVAFEESVAVYRSADAQPTDVAEARFGLAEALVETGGDKSRAASLTRKALKEYRQAGPVWARREHAAAALLARIDKK